MKRRNFLKSTGGIALAAAGTGLLVGCTGNATLKSGEILHTVIFDLKYPVGSNEANKFLEDGKKILTKVPGVHNFQVFRQCSPKNNYQYGFYMRFSSQKDFESYNAHPDHVKFVAERWDKEIARFQESDFQTY